MSDASWEKFGHLPAAGKPWERFSWTQYGGDHGPGLELLHTGPGPPSGECPGPHEYDLYGPGDELLTITRWCFRPYLWEEKLRAAGFASAAGQRLPCPKDRQTIGTLVVQATV
ncbi:MULTISPECIES: hypothetical protein [Streptomyces]|uniref:hypothetical protein n=1 Tax=Streptomyces TaxID=1883 RepID=UPI002F940309